VLLGTLVEPLELLQRNDILGITVEETAVGGDCRALIAERLLLDPGHAQEELGMLIAVV
jgi:hypothetical protein